MLIEQSYNAANLASLRGPELSQLVEHLEGGKVLYFPNLPFPIENALLLGSTAHLGAGRKSMTYDSKDGSIKGIQHNNTQTAAFQEMMHRYMQFAHNLISHLCPVYQSHLVTGRTSFRPIEVKGRKSSYRKDDTRLHVDAFPSTPMGNKRILRVFSNVNPFGADRVWKLGEPFEEVVAQFFNKLRKPIWGEFQMAYKLRLTGTKRTPYDHYMLQLHNSMKYDLSYQAKAKQQTVYFPPGSTWVVYSDRASHAALEGAYLAEQTFYLDYEHMQDPHKAPQSILSEYINKEG